jgi:hypothetical protein
MPYTNFDYAFKCSGGYTTVSFGATSASECNVPSGPGNYGTDELWNGGGLFIPFYRIVFKPCEPGTYQPFYAQTSCYAASPGTYINVPGATSPGFACSPGTYQPGYGGTSCLLADVDHYVPGAGASYELTCPAGTHQPVPGSTSCVTAKQGQTITFGAPADQIVGATLALNATATSGLTVAFTSLTPGVCSVTGPSVTANATGICTLQANQAGNASFSAAAPEEQSFDVTYGFVGFSQPVDGNGVLNSANAGKTVPLKWRVVDANLNPIADLADVTVQAVTLSCAVGATPDAIEEYAAGGSGLQNLGDGYYQWNWKTPSSYAKSCKTLTLDLGDGSTHTALFSFTK